jgi:hypothetical protein
MKKHEKIDLIIAGEGLLLTQAQDVVAEERFFSSRVYDGNLENWIEWTIEHVENFIHERETNKEIQEESTIDVEVA